MRIGYACLTVAVPGTDLRSCTMKNANNEKLYELIAYNLNSLDHILDYNIENNIRLFRISSDLIPFGSSPVNRLLWWELFEEQLKSLGEKIINSGMRVSMHPGQYTVLNSPDEEVVDRAISDLNYHGSVLDSLKVGPEHKIVLHIGGVYNDKAEAIKRFKVNYQKLNATVKQRLIIENDDKSYHVADVLSIASELGIPVVFDNLHHSANPPLQEFSEVYWINECKKTWKKKDGPQKMHYSQQDHTKKSGSHSQSVRIGEFMDFYNRLEREDIDIMLEVKDKNISAVKCINCTSGDHKIKNLEIEWGRYKYSVLEKSQEDYNTIRQLLKNKQEYPATSFYEIIEDALQKSGSTGEYMNAALHVWGYVKDEATSSEKSRFLKNMDDFQQGKLSLQALKNNLWRLSLKYNRPYLLNSYYFSLSNSSS